MKKDDDDVDDDDDDDDDDNFDIFIDCQLHDLTCLIDISIIVIIITTFLSILFAFFNNLNIHKYEKNSFLPSSSNSLTPIITSHHINTSSLLTSSPCHLNHGC